MVRGVHNFLSGWAITISLDTVPAVSLPSPNVLNAQLSPRRAGVGQSTRELTGRAGALHANMAFRAAFTTQLTSDVDGLLQEQYIIYV